MVVFLSSHKYCNTLVLANCIRFLLSQDNVSCPKYLEEEVTQYVRNPFEEPQQKFFCCVHRAQWCPENRRIIMWGSSKSRVISSEQKSKDNFDNIVQLILAWPANDKHLWKFPMEDIGQVCIPPICNPFLKITNSRRFWAKSCGNHV